MLTNAIHRWDDVLTLAKGGLVMPHVATLHTCNLCNQFCVGCAYRGKHDKSVLDYEGHIKAINILCENGVKAFEFCGGGDPALIEGLPDIMRYMSEKKLVRGIGLMTNGLEMSDELMKALISYGAYVRISMEAANLEDYMQYKNVPKRHFTTVIDNVRKLVNRRNNVGSKLEISLKFAVGKSLRGYQHYLGMNHLAGFLQVDKFFVKPLRHEPEELTLIERLEELKVFQKVYTSMLRVVPVKQSFISTMVANPCWLNPLHTVMDHLGNLYICCYYYYREESHKIGNIFYKDFRDIWFGEEHRKKIRSIKREDCDKVDCKYFEHHKAVNELIDKGTIYFL